MNTGISATNEEVQKASAFVRPLFTEIGKVVIGQAYLVFRGPMFRARMGDLVRAAYFVWDAP